MNKKKSTGILLSILGVISLVLITAGVTYAFFTYAKEGETENTITTGTITFLYDETDKQGRGINITEAMPMDDAIGMALNEEGQVFDFTITSEVSKGAEILYMITAREDDESTLSADRIKVYLDVDGSNGSHVKNLTDTNHTFDNSKVVLFSKLDQLSTTTPGTVITGDNDGLEVTVPEGIVERVLYEGKVPANSISGDGGSSKYTASFKLRMWINGDDTVGGVEAADYSPYEFVKTEDLTNNDPFDADEFINAGKFITSSAYYAMSTEDRNGYERIALVDTTNRKVYAVSQAKSLSLLNEDGTVKSESLVNGYSSYTASEQFYSLNGQTYNLTVNVYANAAVVEQGE